jgi:hypothetical protein
VAKKGMGYSYDKANPERSNGGKSSAKGGRGGIDDGYTGTSDTKSFGGDGQANVTESRINSGANRSIGQKGIGNQ